MARTVVIGLGSPHGDDRAGWALVDLLGPHPGPDAEAAAVSEPCRLLDHLDNCDHLILVDAARGGQAPGTVRRLTCPGDDLLTSLGRSSHGLGLGAILALGEALNRLPPRVTIFGLEAGDCAPDGDLSAAAAVALPVLRDAVLAELGP